MILSIVVNGKRESSLAEVIQLNPRLVRYGFELSVAASDDRDAFLNITPFLQIALSVMLWLLQELQFSTRDQNLPFVFDFLFISFTNFCPFVMYFVVLCPRVSITLMYECFGSTFFFFSCYPLTVFRLASVVDFAFHSLLSFLVFVCAWPPMLHTSTYDMVAPQYVRYSTCLLLSEPASYQKNTVTSDSQHTTEHLPQA